MPPLLVDVLLASWVLLVLLVALGGVRARSFAERALALEVLSMLFVGVLGLAALRHGHAGVLDIGIVLALLGLAQTVAGARLVARRRTGDE